MSQAPVAEKPSADIASARPLLATDRCDARNAFGSSCGDIVGAQAWVRAVMPGGGELLFCGHHAERAMPELRRQSLQIDDFREKINARSESST